MSLGSRRIVRRAACPAARPTTQGGPMAPREIANRYYDAWINRGGDMSQVPLAEDLVFRGPVPTLHSAEGPRPMPRQAGAAVTSFRVRYQVSDGDRVCSVVDWTMAPGPGTLTPPEGL